MGDGTADVGDHAMALAVREATQALERTFAHPGGPAEVFDRRSVIRRLTLLSTVISGLESLRLELALDLAQASAGEEMPLDLWREYAAAGLDDEPSRAERQQDRDDERDELVTLRSLRIGGDR